MLIKVYITKDILMRSMNCIGNMVGQNCAVALAIYDLFGNRSWVSGDMIEIFEEPLSVDPQAIVVKPMYTIPLPVEAQDFIEHFDNLIHKREQRLRMEEISFDIEVSDNVIDMINIDEVHRVLESCQSLSLAQ